MVNCKWCLSKNTIKDGLLRGKQLYLCKDCGRKFTDTTRNGIYDRFIAWCLYNACKDKAGNNKFTHTKMTANQIAKILSRSPQTVLTWTYKPKPKKVYERELRQYLETRKNGADILNLLGLGSPIASMSEFLLEIITRKPKPKKKITKKDLEKQQQLERKQQQILIIEKQKERAMNTPISDRKNAIEKLWVLFGCSQRQLFGLRFSDLDRKNIGDKFNFSWCVQFERGEIKIMKDVSLFDHNDNKVYVITERIKEIVLWLKTNSEKNRQTLGMNYDPQYSDFLCVKDNGKFFRPHELKRE